MNIKNFMSYADLFSLANASFGFLSIVMAFKGYLDISAQFILIAVIFDSLDGWVARRTKRVDHCEFGENIDSLSDVISFGVAPGMLLITATSTFAIPYLNIGVALLILLCGVLRLARFNVITNSSEVKDEKFVGLPIPTTALILGSFYLSGIFQADLAMLIMVVVSLMMVSTIEYPKIRSMNIVIIGSLVIFLTLLPQNISSLIADIPAKLLFIGSLIYLITVPFMDLYSKLRRSDPNVR